MRLKGCGSGGCTQITCAMSSTDGPDLAEATEERCFLSTAEAAALERELLEDYRFGRQQLVEWCGHASAVAVTKVQLINNAYRLVVDAVLGPGVEPGEVGGPCTRALATLKLLSIPLVSLDIPSGMPGWDPETGGDAEDGLRPDVLVSLAAPKRCAGRFSGRHHFVAGRFVPDDVRRKFALRLPGYTGTDCIAAL
ncbi:hypothetical protein Celaphus_00002922 [Cervus elaphus hippelaphus]|uniref:YjeF N-terminal domain-containing protein n=1 Tax=Cervus elaphus hippelaphus TaxID=46360 RepID=A0A212D1P6_CEREH|nr:hypothetical protein Celaphus_00002922 [Cervus elaphus hippelaphus]